MSKLITLTIAILLLSKYSECCDLLKYKHTPFGKADLFEKLSNEKKCNGMPIYKAVDDLFFIYKLAHSDFWCNSYLPSKIVVCQAECDEIRFDFNNVFSRQGAIPQEFIAHYSEWIPLSNQAIQCNDEEYIDEVSVFDDFHAAQTAEQPRNETALNRTHEMLLDQVLHFVGTLHNTNSTQNNSSNLEIKTTQLNKTAEELQAELIKSENEYIVMKMMERTEESRLQKLRDQIIFKSLVLKNDTKLNETTSTTDDSFVEMIEDEDGYILSMVKWERDNSSLPIETTPVVSLNETDTTTIAQLNRDQQEEEDSYILSMVKSILEDSKLINLVPIETTTFLPLNRTVPLSEEQPVDEDKYILSMVLNFSDDEKRQMLPERK